MAQKSLSRAQVATLQSHGPLVGCKRHILEQHVFPGEIPYFTWLVVEGCLASYRHELLEQLKNRARVRYKVVMDIISSPTFKLSTTRTSFKCALVSPSELGLDLECTLDELTERAESRGLKLLPTDAALFASLQFAASWTTVKLVVFMSEPVEHQGQRFLFALEDRLLNVIAVEDGQKCHPDHSYMFARK